VLATSLLRGRAFEGYARKIAAREFDPAGFYLKLGLKDVRLALASGEDAAVPLPLASLLRDHYLEAVAYGDAERDWSAVSDSPRRNAGLK
jgi:3-hydroxyisobutyrate dehydrogenase-like beta-hydroxyacid dehydrogenase